MTDMEEEELVFESVTPITDTTNTTTSSSEDATSTVRLGEGDEEQEQDGLEGLEDICQSIGRGEDEAAQRIAADLTKYIELLPHAPSSFNALLDAEHNSCDEKARGLLRYYQERPNLVEYTLEKELPRMDYIWIDAESGEFIQDKTRIAGLFVAASRSEQDHMNILPRCANQSLLADLLQFLSSGHDNALIRRQHHMAVNTKKVSIVVMPSNGTVLAKANLELSLPHPAQGLIHIATVHVSCQFSPVQQPPLFHYHVEKVDVVKPCPDETEILEMAYFLHDLPSQLTVEEEEAAAAELNYMKRDAFLQRTKSSWKQMNANLAQKLMFRNNNPGGSTERNNPANNALLKSQQNLKRQMDRLKTAVSQPRINPRLNPRLNDPASSRAASARFGAGGAGAGTDRPDARPAGNMAWKKQQENLKNQLNRFKAAMGPSSENINSSNNLDTAPSRTNNPRGVNKQPREAPITPGNENRTNQDIFRPSWKQKQESLKNKMNSFKSSVLDKAGSKAMSRSDISTRAADVNEPINAAGEKRQDVGDRPKWSGRLRTGWNRLAQSLPNKNNNSRREGIESAPSAESEELVFSATQSSDFDEGGLFDSPTVSPFARKTTDSSTTSSSTASLTTSSVSNVSEPKVPHARGLDQRQRSSQSSQRRWNSGRRFPNLLKINS